MGYALAGSNPADTEITTYIWIVNLINYILLYILYFLTRHACGAIATFVAFIGAVCSTWITRIVTLAARVATAIGLSQGGEMIIIPHNCSAVGGWRLAFAVAAAGLDGKIRCFAPSIAAVSVRLLGAIFIPQANATAAVRAIGTGCFFYGARRWRIHGFDESRVSTWSIYEIFAAVHNPVDC